MQMIKERMRPLGHACDYHYDAWETDLCCDWVILSICGLAGHHEGCA